MPEATASDRFAACLLELQQKINKAQAMVDAIHHLPEEHVTAEEEDACEASIHALHTKLRRISTGDFAAAAVLDTDAAEMLRTAETVLKKGELQKEHAEALRVAAESALSAERPSWIKTAEKLAEAETEKVKQEVLKLESIICDLEKSIARRKMDIHQNEKELARSAAVLEKARGVVGTHPNAIKSEDYSKMKSNFEAKKMHLTQNQMWLKKLLSTLEEVKQKHAAQQNILQKRLELKLSASSSATSMPRGPGS